MFPGERINSSEDILGKRLILRIEDHISPLSSPDSAGATQPPEGAVNDLDISQLTLENPQTARSPGLDVTTIAGTPATQDTSPSSRLCISWSLRSQQCCTCNTSRRQLFGGNTNLSVPIQLHSNSVAAVHYLSAFQRRNRTSSAIRTLTFMPTISNTSWKPSRKRKFSEIDK